MSDNSKTTDGSREASVARFAQSIREGKASRISRFGWREGWTVPNSTGPSVDITDEVLAAAGPETAEETALRAVEDERRFPYRLGDAIARDLYEEFCMQWRPRYLGQKFELAEDDEDSDALTLIREDGKRYEIEIDVHARVMS